MAEMTIRRFGVFSVAKMYSLVMFIMGLIFGVIYGLFLMLFGAAMSALGARETEAMGAIGSVVMGLVVMIAIPILYGIMGFIIGIIGALIYNFGAGIIGGVRLDLEGTSVGYAPPPPTREWSGNPYTSNP